MSWDGDLEDRVNEEQNRKIRSLQIAERHFLDWVSIGEYGMAYNVAVNFFENNEQVKDSRIEDMARLYIYDLLNDDDPAEALEIARESCSALENKCASEYFDFCIREKFFMPAYWVAQQYFPDRVPEAARKVVDNLFKKKEYDQALDFAIKELPDDIERLARKAFNCHCKEGNYVQAFNCAVHYPDALGALQQKIMPYALNQQIDFYEQHLLSSKIADSNKEKDMYLKVSSYLEEDVLVFAKQHLPKYPILEFKCKKSGKQIKNNIEERISEIRDAVRKNGKSARYYYMYKDFLEATEKEDYESAANLRDQLMVEKELINKGGQKNSGGFLDASRAQNN